jgi:hypothetical protein
MTVPPLLVRIVLLLHLLALPASALDKWFYQSANLLVDENIEKLSVLWKRASAAGYTHVILADSKFGRLGSMPPRYFKNVDRVKEIARSLNIEVVPALFPIGYSNSLLGNDVNLVEGLPVKDLPLVVQDGIARVDDPDAPTLPGGGCEDLGKWSWKDETVVADQGAALIRDGGGKNARLAQKLTLKPWRQYHVSVRVKTEGFHGEPEIKAIPAKAGNVSLQWANLGVQATQDWKTHHVVFNSQDYGEVTLYFGVWGAGQGSLWWDDARIEEAAFVNMTRRSGTPLRVQTDEGNVLEEGRDFQELRDPLLGAKPWPGEYDSFHEPPALKTGLPEGTKLRASYYHAVTVYDGQAMICLSDPKTYGLLREQARRMHEAWGAKAYMMSHDEVRVANWCEDCRKRKLTPGELLADNARRCLAILREINPGGRVYVWGDMFDPNHNAVPGPYYLVNGPLTGSWEGLDPEVIVVPWLESKGRESLGFFAGRGNRQLIAGYYDKDPRAVLNWLEAARSVPGSVAGVMYTTWEQDYSNLEAFGALVDSAK